MENKVLGIDLGTNSIGLAVRNVDIQGSVSDQLEYFTSIIFPSGVGSEKGNEFSYAAQRTKYRSSRRLNQARRYRIWRTLEVLIQNGYCPLSMEDLDKWRIYNKEKGLQREYPIGATKFEQWVRLDFDCDGLPEYSSPYQLRAELMKRKFDLENQTDRYKLGRALYHIAQRRGFKSSKGETSDDKKEEAEVEEENTSEALKKSEEKKSHGLRIYMEEHHCETVGCAFYQMEQEGQRVRGNEKLQAVRALYKEEIEKIFEYQNLPQDEFYQRILSEKPDGSIFYKRKLRSQKGTVGHCTLEPSKTRCPQSRPEFELFRAWSLINNIRYRYNKEEDWRDIELAVRQEIFEAKFTRTKKTFPISEIREWLEKKAGTKILLNYPDKTTVSGCPVISRLIKLMGPDWQKEEICGYNYEELWHVCFEAGDDVEYVKDFAIEKLQNDNDIIDRMERLWGSVSVGYAMLSLKAIKNILYFLQKGYIYSDAVILAKLPDLFGNRWNEVENTILAEYQSLKQTNAQEKRICKITNELIAAYKVLPEEEQFAVHNTDYLLDAADKKEIERTAKEVLSNGEWKSLGADEKQSLLEAVSHQYQEFFHSADRDYRHSPKLTDTLQEFVLTNFIDFLSEGIVAKLQAGKQMLYHPSAIDIYKPAKYQKEEYNGEILNKRLLNSPATSAFRNPMVMRVLHTLRRQINELILSGVINEDDTRIVVETARELNDANMRAAISKYQKQREDENKKIEEAIRSYYPTMNIKDADIDKARLLFEQANLDEGREILTAVTKLPDDAEEAENGKKKRIKNISSKDLRYAKAVEKYLLWKEQNFRCIYTGKMISLSSLFNDDQWEIEHTIPRSISFDDSLANKTICETHYNRYTKKNQIPSQLADYASIQQRIQPWKDKCEKIKNLVIFWRSEAKKASTPDRKDQCIQEAHLWSMELDYWRDKVRRFEMQPDDINLGFRNSQLVDTRIITKYAFHYLKTVFNKVEVQRGEMTADFRKAFGIQSLAEKKDRTKHSHHAIDATMLTLIPTNKKRDEILELFYQIEEAKKINADCTQEQIKLKKLISTCNIKDVGNVPDFINENILIHHTMKDQTLTPASRKMRIRGRVVKKDNQTKYITGDCIRGQLHLETWYGAIAKAKVDENGKMIRDEHGNYLVDEDNISYVVRRPLKYKANANDSGFANWEELKAVMVDQALFDKLKDQYPGLSLKEACDDEHGLYSMHNGKKCKIRHIRCYVPTVKQPLHVKQQTYLSSKTYKRDYLAAQGDLKYMVKYQSEDGKQKEFKTYSLFDISQNRKLGIEDILPFITNKKGVVLRKNQILRKGLSILVYESSPDELRGASADELSKRLYVIRGFEASKLIKLVHHLSAKKDGDLGKGESIKDYNNLPEKIRCGISTLNYLLEGNDFEFTPNQGIKFK